MKMDIKINMMINLKQFFFKFLYIVIFICYSKCVFILIDVVLWGLLFKFFFNNKNVFYVLLEICVGNGYSLINFKFLEKKEIKFL